MDRHHGNQLIHHAEQGYLRRSLGYAVAAIIVLCGMFGFSVYCLCDQQAEIDKLQRSIAENAESQEDLRFLLVRCQERRQEVAADRNSWREMSARQAVELVESEERANGLAKRAGELMLSVEKLQAEAGKVAPLELANKKCLGTIKSMAADVAERDRQLADLKALLADSREQVADLRDELQKAKAVKTPAVVPVAAQAVGCGCRNPNCRCKK